MWHRKWSKSDQRNDNCHLFLKTCKTEQSLTTLRWDVLGRAQSEPLSTTHLNILKQMLI